MSTLAEAITLPPSREALPSRSARAWLVSPWFDALFLANVAWPLLAVLLFVFGPEFHEGIRFWQIYFVTAPHRWITLGIVFLDRDRFAERPLAFSLIAASVVLLCVGVRLSTGTLTCLLAIDYIWNAWHFASQHAGILRIYGRQASIPTGWCAVREKLLVRCFLLYVILRMSGLEWSLLGESVAAISGSSMEWTPALLDSRLQWLDWLVLLIPGWLVVLELSPRRHRGQARLLYLGSFLSLYLALLAATHIHRYDLVLCLSTVSALFHATEYLAIVSWAVRKRFPEKQPQPGNMLAAMIPRWGLMLGTFAVSLAILGWIADRQVLQVWLTLNIIAAFLHYAYDGMIWKRRRMTAGAG